MKQEYYQKVACIGLKNLDGSLMLNVPLYVKVNELNKNGMTDMQESLIRKVSGTMMKHYDKQISNYMVNLKHGVSQNMAYNSS